MSLAIATTNANKVTDILSKKGKVVGKTYSFGTLTAAEIRAAGRDLGLKGNALSNYVNEALMSEVAQRRAAGAVFLSVAESKGFVPDKGDLRKSTGVLRLVKPKEVVAESDEVAKLKAEIEALRAQLAK